MGNVEIGGGKTPRNPTKDKRLRRTCQEERTQNNHPLDNHLKNESVPINLEQSTALEPGDPSALFLTWLLQCHPFFSSSFLATGLFSNSLDGSSSFS